MSTYVNRFLRAVYALVLPSGENFFIFLKEIYKKLLTNQNKVLKYPYKVNYTNFTLVIYEKRKFSWIIYEKEKRLHTATFFLCDLFLFGIISAASTTVFAAGNLDYVELTIAPFGVMSATRYVASDRIIFLHNRSPSRFIMPALCPRYTFCAEKPLTRTRFLM